MQGHGGNIWRLARQLGCEPEELLDFSANINPLGQPDGLRRTLLAGLDLLNHYPDPENSEAQQALADFTAMETDCLVVGNGTSELLFSLVRELRPSRTVLPVPSYIDYANACTRAGSSIEPYILDEEDGFQIDTRRLAAMLGDGDLVLIGQPNNPTGTMVPRDGLLDLCAAHPGTWFIIDEAFAGFVPDYSSLAGTLPNIAVLASLTKLFAVPGLRLGYLAGPRELCRRVRSQLSPWSVNTLAQAAVPVCLGDAAFQQESVRAVQEYRRELLAALRKFRSLTPFNSCANYLLLKINIAGWSAPRLAEALLTEHRIMIRPCGNYQGLDDRYFRVAVKSPAENRRLVQALAAVLEKTALVRGGRRKRTPAVMLLGTGSDVGKSVLAAGLCRVLLQDGLQPAPFKAQNMSLNSYVTLDGGEMGRAQVVQAQACRLEPDVRMNPILLKPNTDVGSQVIVLGRPVANMEVGEYFRYKPTIWESICTTYDEMSRAYDCMVLEGAGSPGEVNLMRHDIVNLKMARHARAAGLLVGDIDRGGVYASFIGHHQVLPEADRNLIRGFIVNRFRGDMSLLDEAHAYVRAATGIPVLGVVEYLPRLGLPQEDSVNFRAGVYDSGRPEDDHVEIALVDLPHISNFTDIEALVMEPDVWLRRVRHAEELGSPDAVILPGSKNVIADLDSLRASGLGERILSLAGTGCEIIGICGGYQMLGSTIEDPHGIEGPAGQSTRGLGLLDITTSLAPGKQLVRRQGLHHPTGTPVVGYEIHHGVSGGGGEPLFRFTDGAACGTAAHDALIWGCYLHGIFDSDPFRHAFIEGLRERKGLPPYAGQRAVYDLEPALDRLADILRKRLDLRTIYQMMGL